MGIFKNKVGRPLGKENKIKKIKRNLIVTLYIILAVCTIMLFKTNYDFLKGETASTKVSYRYVKNDSTLRKKPNNELASSISVVRGTKVRIRSCKKGSDYCRVTIEKSKEENKGFYLSDYTGYILKSRLTKSKVKHSSNNRLSVTSKTRIVRNAYLLYKYNGKNNSNFNFKYNYGSDYRKTGYNFVVYKKTKNSGTYYFDCSALVSTLYKATFNVNFNDGEGKKINRTYQFLNNVKGKEKGDETDYFYIVDKVSAKSKSERKKLYTYLLQTGDLILGINKESSSEDGNSNHIMLYVGDARIFHATSTNDSALEFKKLTNKYVKLGESDSKYTKEIYILRPKVNEKLYKLNINKNKTKITRTKIRG